MTIRLWPRTWATPRFAWSCLMIQLYTLQEFRMQPCIIPDDATPEEVRELAEEQRAMRNSTRALPDFASLGLYDEPNVGYHVVRQATVVTELPETR